MINHYPSLLLVMNTEEAIWYKIAEDSMEQIEKKEMKRERYTDDEELYMSHVGQDAVKAGASEKEHGRKREHLHQFFTAIAEVTLGCWDPQVYRHFVLVVPEQHKNSVQEELKKHASHLGPYKVVLGNHTYKNKEQIRELFEESLKVFHE